MAVRPIPEGYHSLTPYLAVSDGGQAIDFYVRAFGAIETMRLPGPTGSVAHAEVRIGDSAVMLSDQTGGLIGSPDQVGGATCSLMIYVEDVDAAFDRAVAAGATAVRPVANAFYGDRTGVLKDPFGHVWSLATHVEDVTPEEMRRRMDAMAKPE